MFVLESSNVYCNLHIKELFTCLYWSPQMCIAIYTTKNCLHVCIGVLKCVLQFTHQRIVYMFVLESSNVYCNLHNKELFTCLYWSPQICIAIYTTKNCLHVCIGVLKCVLQFTQQRIVYMFVLESSNMYCNLHNKE